MSDEQAQEQTTAIVKREPTDIFQHFDSMDDEAIVAELEGRLMDFAVYHFPQEGKELWGLSKVGIDWCVTQLAKEGFVIRDEGLNFAVDPTDPAYVLFTATVGKYFVAKDGAEAKVDVAIGNKRQGVKIRRRDGTMMPDPFWFEKGAQKAIRNARSRLIPEETKAKIIAKAKEIGKVKEVQESDVWQGRKTEGGQVITATRTNAPMTDGMKRGTAPPPAPSTSQFYLLDKFKTAKKELGEEAYKEILGAFGYEHSKQVPVDTREAVLDTMRQYLKDKRSAS